MVYGYGDGGVYGEGAGVYGTLSEEGVGAASGSFAWVGAVSGERTSSGAASGAVLWQGYAGENRYPLVAEYGFNEPGGSLVSDSSGELRDITLTDFQSSRYDGHTLKGLWGAVGATAGGMAASAPRTLMFWANLVTVAPQGLYARAGDTFLQAYLNVTTIELVAYYAGRSLSQPTSLPRDVWFHLALVADPANSLITVYVDGAPITSGPLSVSSTDASGIEVTATPFAGMDDLRVFDAALTQAEVQQWMNTYVGMPYGEAAGAFGWAGSASGEADHEGSASGAFVWAGSAIGANEPVGVASGAFMWTGSAEGETQKSGIASGAFSWAGASSGTTDREGSAGGAFAWTGFATGGSGAFGVAAGTFSWAGSATGATEPIGQASGSFSWTGTAAGSVDHDGGASGAFSWAGSAAGATNPEGTAAGLFSWVGEAEGEAPSGGSASGSFAWAGSAAGEAPRGGTTSGVFGWVGAASGKVDKTGTAAGDYGFMGEASGSAAYGGTAAGTWTFTGSAAAVEWPWGCWGLESIDGTLQLVEVPGSYDLLPGVPAFGTTLVPVGPVLALLEDGCR